MDLLLAIAVIAVFIYMTATFAFSLQRKRTDIADIAWGLGFILLTSLSLLSQPNWTLRMMIISAMVLIWGVRLSIYVYVRNIGKGEDYRYRRWRIAWAENFATRVFLEVFMLRGVFMLLMAMPLFLVSVFDNNTLNYSDLIGVILWVIGFLFEAISDAQLLRFNRHNDLNDVLQTGLWRYSRHPNYFGESLQWWGIFVIALAVDWGWAAIISPIIITLMLTKITGIPLVEQQYQDNSVYQEYKARTSAFFPRRPKKN